MTNKQADILCYILAGVNLEEFAKQMIKNIEENSECKQNSKED